MNLRWKHACILATSVALAALVVGCEQKSRCETEGVKVEISGDHGHTMDVPKDHVARKVGGTYPITGGDHQHAVTLKDADMQQLAEGKTATTRASSVNAHTHEVKAGCK